MIRALNALVAGCGIAGVLVLLLTWSAAALSGLALVLIGVAAGIELAVAVDVS